MILLYMQRVQSKSLNHFKAHTKVMCFAFLLLVFSGSEKLFSSEAKDSCKSSTISIQTINQQYQKRILGNTAFDSGLYDTAMAYYKCYLKNAGGNSPATRDAYFCLIATCLRSNKIDEAKKLYDELKTKFNVFFKNSPNEQSVLEYWAAEILLKEECFEKAEAKFKDILSGLSGKNGEEDLSIKVQLGLGIIKIRQEKWKEAENIFLKLKKSENKKIINLANQQLILINVVLGNNDKAKKLIHSCTENKKRLTTQFRLLEVYSLINEKKYTEAQQNYNHLRKFLSPPNTIWYIVAEAFANSYINNNQQEKAIPFFEDAAIAAPNMYYKEKSVLSLTNALLATHQYQKTINAAIFALNNFPNTSMKDKILLCLTQLLVKEKRYKQAAEYSNKYSNLIKPATEEKIKIACETGQALLSIKEYDKAVNYFKYAAENGITPEERSLGQYLLAETILLEKKYDQALKLFEKLKETQAWNKKARLKIAQIYFEQNDLNKAAENLRSLVEENSKTNTMPAAIFLYAVTLKKLQKTEEAIDNFVKFAETNPNDSEALNAYFEAGCLAMNNYDYKQAIKCFQKILKKYKDSDKVPGTLYRLLYANSLEGKNKTAKQYAEKIVNQFPNSKFLLNTSLWLVNYYKNNKEYDKALNILKEIKRTFSKIPSAISEILYNEAYILFLKNKNPEALKIIYVIESKYSNTPLLAQSLFLKGDILSNEGKYIDAISSYLKTTQTTENNDLNNAAWGRVGDCYFAKQLLLKAAEYYNKILDSSSLSSLFKIQTLYKLGKCYELLNEKEKAIAKYHEAVYGSILDARHGDTLSKEWFAKSGIALAKLLQQKNTAVSAKNAIEVYKTMIKYNVQPTESFYVSIQKLKNKFYKL